MNRLTQKPDKAEPLLRIQAVNKFYGSRDSRVHVLHDVNLVVQKGEFISIMGPSGSGKSTLINIIGLLDHQFEGSYLLNGEPIEKRTDQQISHLRNDMVGFIFQDFNLIDTMTVADNIALPLLYSGLKRRQTKEQVIKALKRVDLVGKEESYPHELSGGQKQRVAIARALINEPHFIIADEPTGALDTKTSKMIMDTIKQMHEQANVTVIMVTHDPRLEAYATRHIRIVDGRIMTDQLREERDAENDITITLDSEVAPSSLS